MTTLYSIAVDLEKQLFRERWLMARDIIKDLSIYDRIKVFRMIEDESTRVTREMLSKARELANSDDLSTIQPL